MDARQPAEQSDRSREPLNEVNPNEGSLLQMLTVMPMDKNRFVTRAPSEPFRLTYIDVMCLVINRMIGMLVCGFWWTSKWLQGQC
jgi:hypothetical protein